MIGRQDEEELRQADHNLIKHMLSELQYILAGAVDRPWSADIARELGTLFSSCLEFYRVLLRQPAQFGVEMIFARTRDGQERLFDPSIMTDVSNEQVEVLQDRVIEMSLFPLVYKRGDERGDNVRTALLISA